MSYESVVHELVETCGVCFHLSQVSPIDLKYEKYFQEHPISVLCPER